jgi:hypothetical protein
MPRLFLSFLSLFTNVPERLSERVGGACGEALRTPYGPPKRYFSDHFGLRIRPKFTVRALFIPLFGQSQKKNSAKFTVAISPAYPHPYTNRDGAEPHFSPLSHP